MRLYRISGRGYKPCSQELGSSIETLGAWVKQANIDEGKADGLTSEEKKELTPLEAAREAARGGEGDSSKGRAILRPGDRSSV